MTGGDITAVPAAWSSGHPGQLAGRGHVPATQRTRLPARASPAAVQHHPRPRATGPDAEPGHLAPTMPCPPPPDPARTRTQRAPPAGSAQRGGISAARRDQRSPAGSAQQRARPQDPAAARAGADRATRAVTTLHRIKHHPDLHNPRPKTHRTHTGDAGVRYHRPGLKTGS